MQLFMEPGLNFHCFPGIRICPNGELLAVTAKDGTVRLWPTETGDKPRILVGHTSEIHNAVFSQDGMRLAAATKSSARVWNVATGEQITIVRGNEDGLYLLSFSADGTKLLTAGRDQTVRVWNVENGSEVARMEVDGFLIKVARFDPIATRIVAAGPFGAKIWPFREAQALVEHAKHAAPRCLTVVERQAFFLAPEPPRWCVTGPGQEAQSGSDRWKAKWPYRGLEWRKWLAMRDKGEHPPTAVNRMIGVWHRSRR